jgi:Beta-lactamase enzyme family
MAGRHAYPRRGHSNILVVAGMAVLVALAAPAVAAVRGWGGGPLPGVSAVDTVSPAPVVSPSAGSPSAASPSAASPTAGSPTAGSPSGASTTPGSTTTTVSAARRRDRAVRAAVTSALHERLATVDLAITAVAGRQVVHVGAGRPVRTASIIKLLVLRAVQARGPLTSTERRLATRMITRSDNAATGRLWRLSGGNSAVARAAAAAGMKHTTPMPRLLPRWDRWQTTAEDQVKLLVSISRGRGAADRYARTLMAQVIPSQRWGVGDLAGATGVKNGWLPVRGRWIVNSDGCARQAGRTLCLSVLSIGSRTFPDGVRTVRLAVAAAARAWALS